VERTLRGRFLSCVRLTCVITPPTIERHWYLHHHHHHHLRTSPARIPTSQGAGFDCEIHKALAAFGGNPLVLTHPSPPPRTTSPSSEQEHSRKPFPRVVTSCRPPRLQPLSRPHPASPLGSAHCPSITPHIGRRKHRKAPGQGSSLMHRRQRKYVQSISPERRAGFDPNAESYAHTSSSPHYSAYRSRGRRRSESSASQKVVGHSKFEAFRGIGERAWSNCSTSFLVGGRWGLA
jgi:hypothetical protein